MFAFLMQEIFDTSFILKSHFKKRNFTLYNLILKELEEMLTEAKFFYGISPKTSAILNCVNITKNISADCIFAPLVLHKTNNILDVLIKIKDNLNKGGIFLGNFFGLLNLKELGELLASEDYKHAGRPLMRMLPVIDIKTAGGLLQKAGFNNIIASSQIITFEFESLKKALQFLKESGEQNCLCLRDKSLFSGNILKKYIENFQSTFKLSFDVCFFSCLKS